MLIKFYEKTNKQTNTHFKVNIFVVCAGRTPVKWVKYRPEKPMGEITEEGDKDDQDKAQNVDKKDGEKPEGTEENKEVHLVTPRKA